MRYRFPRGADKLINLGINTSEIGFKCRSNGLFFTVHRNGNRIMVVETVDGVANRRQ